MHPDAGGGNEPARGGQLRRDEVVVPEILQVPDAPPLRLPLPDPEAQMHASPHLYRRPASLAVALGVMDVSGRDQATLRVYWQQNGSPRRELLDVYIPGRLARRDGSQSLPGDRLIGRHSASRIG